MSYQIAIDGPAATGKSTTAKLLAKKLGFVYIDTGAMYRAFGLYLIENNISENDEEKINEVCPKVNIRLAYKDGEQQIFLNDKDVTGLIRTEEVSHYASVVSTYKKVREKLVAIQQELGKKQNVIMDGRDIATVVFPNATVKIYLTASVDERVERRYKELLLKGVKTEKEKVKKDLEERDYRDTNRENSPLKMADDAYLVDNTNLTVDEVLEKIEKIYKEKRGK